VLDSYAHQLSGGMRQRVVTVISTLLNPVVLVADEPTSALDVSSQRALVALLRDLMESGCIGSVLFIAHDLPLLGGIADRIAVMYAGRIVEMGPSQDVIHRPQHPYSRGLVDSIVVPEPKLRHRRIDGIAGAPPDLRTPPAGCRFHPRCPVAMPICGCEEPPEVVAEQRRAACWRLLDQPRRDGSAGAIR
jgi:peptide/nickel transport system ATP-binding protein